MKAVFSAADKHGFDDAYRVTYFGNGLLKANKALSVTEHGPFQAQPPATVSFPFWRIIFGLNESKTLMSHIDQMRKLEAL